MLCVRKITFIDRAEPEALWTYNLKKQWNYGGLLAVRVQDANERVLGSTIPMPFVSAQEGETEWGVSWIDEDPVEKPQQPAESEDANPDAVAQNTDGTHAEPTSLAGPQEEPPENVPSQSHPVQVTEEQERPKSPPSQQHSNAPQMSTNVAEDGAAAAAATIVAAAVAAASAPRSATANAPDGQPPTTEGDTVDGASANEDTAGRVATATTNAGEAAATISSSRPSSLPTTPTAAAGAAPSAPATAVSQPEYSSPSVSSPVRPPTPPQERRPSFSSCIPINIAQAARGTLVFDVITATGTKLAVAEANVQAALERDAADSAHVQHFAVVLSPLKMKPKEKQDTTVYAVLEFSVVVGSRDADAAIALSANVRKASMPTSLEAGATCAFSTHTFYFPPKFLTGTGEYIVTNVLCVESRSDNPVRLEVALPEDLKRIGVLPDKKAVISPGGRAIFTFTWNVFDAYVDVGAAKESEADASSAGLHVLIRDGGENKAPVDITLIGDIPSPMSESTGPFAFYVNHARVSNIACSAADDALLADILPISLVTRAGI